jgi:hypothetical protein
VRKWTKSACMVLAWSILPILAAADMPWSAGPAQATHSIASSTTQVTLMTLIRSASTQTADRQPGGLASTGPHRSTPSPTPILGGQAPRPAPLTARATPAAGDVPPWLKAMLLAAGIVTGLALLAESTLAAGRRLQDRGRRLAVRRASIIRADHERLIVTYSLHDDTIYVLTPPDEDPRAVLRAARLVLPEEKYQELADELGIPDSEPTERQQ